MVPTSTLKLFTFLSRKNPDLNPTQSPAIHIQSHFDSKKFQPTQKKPKIFFPSKKDPKEITFAQSSQY